MKKAASTLFLGTLLLFFPCQITHLSGEVKEVTNFQPFTGKITRDRVRLRVQPSLEGGVIRELNRGEMLLILGETDGFFKVVPPRDLKAYIYRTYVLDGIVEGNKVNVRLKPSVDAPVIAQLNTGDRIEGTISEENSKWMEFPIPKTTHFYVSDDYIEKIGDANFLTRHEKRKQEVQNLLNSTYLVSEKELQKPFKEIQKDQITENYKKIISEFRDFPEEVQTAKRYLTLFEDTYLRKKVSYLESQNTTDPLQESNDKLIETVKNQKEKLQLLEEQLQQTKRTKAASQIYGRWVEEKFAEEINTKMALWIPVELSYYEKWAKKNNNRSIQEFYAEQNHQAIALRGVLETYDRPVRNKPGDYLLVNKINRLPIAYIYSTQVNLQDKIGQEVSLKGALRPNNNFAFPAYFILSAE